MATDGAAAVLPSPEELDAILGSLLLPDSAAIKAAEERLKQISKIPRSTPAIIERAAQSTSPQVRQLAAVIARRKCVRHWTLVGAEEQKRIKEMLLHMIAHEPEHLVRRSTADLLSAIAKLAYPAGQWPDLMQSLFGYSQSPHSEHREAAILIFASLTDTIGDQLREHFKTLIQIFVAGMSDTAQPVRVASVRGVGALLQWLASPEEVEVGASAIPPLLTVAGQCIAAGDEDTVSQVYDTLIEVVGVSFELVEKHLQVLVAHLLQVGCAKDQAELPVRDRAMALVSELCSSRAKLLKRKHLVPQIMKGALALLCELEEDDEPDPDEPQAYKMGTVVVDALALNLPSRQLVPEILSFVSSQIASPDRGARRGAIIALGTCAEGCAESYTENLEMLLPWLLRGMADEDAGVRSWACWALTQFAEFLQPEIVEHYESMLPGIFQALASPDVTVQRRACVALDAFCENLTEELGPYLDRLMAQIEHVLDSEDPELREIGISAVSSAASAVGDAFLPYFPATMQRVGQCMSLTDDAMLTLRARATELGGILAATLKRAAFEPYREAFVGALLAGLQLDSNELREFSYGALANLSIILREEMAALLPTILPMLKKSIDSEDGISLESSGAPVPFGNLCADEDDEDEDTDPRQLQIRTAWLDEKAAAVHCLGALAEGMKGAFHPHLNEAVEYVAKLKDYFHEDVRQGVQVALQKLTMVSFDAHTAPLRAEATAAGHDPANMVHPTTAELFDNVMEEFMRTMEQDDDKETVAQACEAVAVLSKPFGPTAMAKFMSRTVAALKVLFEGGAPCQVEDEEDEGGDEDEEDDQDHDQVLIDAVADLAGCLAECFKQAFAPHFEVLYPTLQKYLRPKRQASDRLMAIGAVAEVCSHLGEACVPYIQPMLPILASGLGDKSASVRRNSVFCCGVFALAAPSQMSPLAGQMLQGIQPLLREEEEDEVRDNAIGALARMLQGVPGAIPVGDILALVVDHFPLQGDEAENEAVSACILATYQSQPALVNPHLGKVTKGMVEVLVEEGGKENKYLKDTTRAGMVAFLVHLSREYASDMAGLFAQLAPAHQEWVKANVTAA